MITVNPYEVAVSVAFTLLFAGAFVLMVLETWLLATGQAPITWHIRREIANYPHAAFIIGITLAFTLGALFAHFYWSKAGGGY